MGFQDCFKDSTMYLYRIRAPVEGITYINASNQDAFVSLYTSNEFSRADFFYPASQYLTIFVKGSIEGANGASQPLILGNFAYIKSII